MRSCRSFSFFLKRKKERRHKTLVEHLFSSRLQSRKHVIISIISIISHVSSSKSANRAYSALTISTLAVADVFVRSFGRIRARARLLLRGESMSPKNRRITTQKRVPLPTLSRGKREKSQPTETSASARHASARHVVRRRVTCASRGRHRRSHVCRRARRSRVAGDDARRRGVPRIESSARQTTTSLCPDASSSSRARRRRRPNNKTTIRRAPVSSRGRYPRISGPRPWNRTRRG